MKNFCLSLALVSLVLLGVVPSRPAAAAETAAGKPSAPAEKEALTSLAPKKGGKVVRTFKTDTAALTGYVLKNAKGETAILYEVGDIIVAGPLLNGEGDSLSDKYEKQYMPKPDYARVVKELDQDKWLIVEGREGAPVLYAFADPNCIFCHKLWEETRDWVAQGKLQIRWAMVAFLKTSSAGRAAAILAAKDRVKANNEDQAKFNTHSEEGGVPALKTIPKDIKAALQKHDAMMSVLQFRGTPGLIFRDKDSKWQGAGGMPPADKLADALGLPK